MTKDLIELHNEMETLRFKFRSPTNKKLRAEFNKKINEIQNKINLIIK